MCTWVWACVLQCVAVATSVLLSRQGKCSVCMCTASWLNVFFYLFFFVQIDFSALFCLLCSAFANRDSVIHGLTFSTRPSKLRWNLNESAVFILTNSPPDVLIHTQSDPSPPAAYTAYAVIRVNLTERRISCCQIWDSPRDANPNVQYRFA